MFRGKLCGTYIFPVKHALRLSVDIIDYVARN